jgi:hypothetical protein
MKTIFAEFSIEMDKVISFVEIIKFSIEIGKADDKKVKSKIPFIKYSKQLKRRLTASSNITPVAYDGAFLRACAEYELTIRKLIEKYIEQATSKCIEYHHLPKQIRDWYLDGCSNIILNLKQDKFKHLTKDAIFRSIASCQKVRNYALIGEAFSDHQRNLWPQELEEILNVRLGLPKVWQKISREVDMQSFIGTADPGTTERVAKSKLDLLLQRRNDIIHRGRSYYSPSDSEVIDCAKYLKVLISCFYLILEKHLLAI